MDRPEAHTPSQTTNPENEELVYCHECENEWFRREHGLQCPDCTSDFTEIIEASQDPRAEIFRASMSNNEPEDDLLHGTHHTRGPLPPSTNDVNPFSNHNPWRDAPDPDEDDIGNFRWRQNGPGSFTLSGTYTRTVPRPGAGGQAAPQNGVAQNFISMLSSILGNGAMNPQSGTPQIGQGPPIPPRPDGFPSMGENQSQGMDFQQGGTGRILGDGGAQYNYSGTPSNHRFHYSTTARVLPPDANHGQPHMGPHDEIHRMMQTIFGPMGTPTFPGDAPAGAQLPQNQRRNPGPDILGLFAQLLGTQGMMGDYVNSSEELDRIISQLMEQNASGSAPGPATEEAIAKLPKKKVDEKMLGSDGTAECSICMDPVNIGEDVTELPCKHWFHGQCVGHWLEQHDTCPHCRKSISSDTTHESGATAPTSPTGPSGRPPQAGLFSPSAPIPIPASSTPPRNIPGAFDSSPSATRGSEMRESSGIGGGSPREERTSSSRQSSSRSHRRLSISSRNENPSDSERGSGNGFASLIRRGLFGPSSRRPSNGGQ